MSAWPTRTDARWRRRSACSEKCIEKDLFVPSQVGIDDGAAGELHEFIALDIEGLAAADEGQPAPSLDDAARPLPEGEPTRLEGTRCLQAQNRWLTGDELAATVARAP